MMFDKANLLFSCLATLFLFNNSIICMNELIDHVGFDISLWKDRKEAVLKCMRESFESNQPKDYCEKGKKLATFNPIKKGMVELYIDENNENEKNIYTFELFLKFIQMDSATKFILESCN